MSIGARNDLGLAGATVAHDQPLPVSMAKLSRPAA
jgi:hypothetical protein